MCARPAAVFSRAGKEVSHIIRQFGNTYKKEYSPTGYISKTLEALLNCRTAQMGGHVDVCTKCNHIRISYNSCRNRHCTKCQSTNRERWIEHHSAKLLPVKYFHVVFTLPHELNGLCIRYSQLLYTLLFEAAWKTLDGFSKNKKHLGADTGMIAILHTWGQQLMLHPHIHCIVPGGGIEENGKWKNTKSQGKYLFPIKEIKKVYRAKFLSGLRKLIKQGRINDQGKKFMDNLFKKEWVVYAKPPFQNSKGVMEYIGRYSHKVAISNSRIQAISETEVTFTYKDYRTEGKKKVLILKGEEFIRRFALHILPKAFVKIRHYGIFSSRSVNRLYATKCILQGQPVIKRERPVKKNWKQICKEKLNFDPDLCPCCKKGRMLIKEFLEKPRRGPPEITAWNNLQITI
jgi:hypothetical protein